MYKHRTSNAFRFSWCCNLHRAILQDSRWKLRLWHCLPAFVCSLRWWPLKRISVMIPALKQHPRQHQRRLKSANEPNGKVSVHRHFPEWNVLKMISIDYIQQRKKLHWRWKRRRSFCWNWRRWMPMPIMSWPLRRFKSMVTRTVGNHSSLLSNRRTEMMTQFRKIQVSYQVSSSWYSTWWTFCSNECLPDDVWVLSAMLIIINDCDSFRFNVDQSKL